MRDHHAVEINDRSQGIREMRDHKAIKRDERSQGSRARQDITRQ